MDSSHINPDYTGAPEFIDQQDRGISGITELLTYFSKRK
jgi:hypothetical protein